MLRFERALYTLIIGLVFSFYGWREYTQSKRIVRIEKDIDVFRNDT